MHKTNIVTYAGNTGKETFYDVMEISNGTFSDLRLCRQLKLDSTNMYLKQAIKFYAGLFQMHWVTIDTDSYCSCQAT
jgi:hypothetical protein